MTVGSYLRFAWAGVLRHPQTGGVIPSQRFLIEKMIEPIPPAFDGLILELGAGTGALTLRLAARCASARIVACELNPSLAEAAKQNLRQAGLSGRASVRPVSAQKLLSETIGRGEEMPGYVLSGIPLGNLGRSRSAALLEVVGGMLPKRGTFVQFQHSLLSRNLIRARFAEVRIVPVLLNFPPAVVYYASRCR